MSNIKKYKAMAGDIEDEFEINVEIDHDIITDEMLHEINNFWSESKDRLRQANGNITEVVVRYLLPFVYAAARRYPHTNVIYTLKAEEGWPVLDGSAGIKLTWHSYLEEPIFDYVKFEEVTA